MCTMYYLEQRSLKELSYENLFGHVQGHLLQDKISWENTFLEILDYGSTFMIIFFIYIEVEDCKAQSIGY